MEDVKAQASGPQSCRRYNFFWAMILLYGHKTQAQAQFERTLIIDPKHAGAKAFLKQLQKCGSAGARSRRPA